LSKGNRKYTPGRCALSAVLLTALGLILAGVPVATAQESSPVDTSVVTDSLKTVSLLPVTDVEVRDNPNDEGGTVRISWRPSTDDSLGRVALYFIYRAVAADGPFEKIGEVTAGTFSLLDGNASDDSSYYYCVVALDTKSAKAGLTPDMLVGLPTAGPVSSSAQWFNFQRINTFVACILLTTFILLMIQQAKSGKKLFIRKIAGLEAVDEAVGRATEMGRKIFYVPGTQDMDNVQTIAGVTILGRVAEMAAQYETWLQVPVSRSLVLVTAREVVKEAYSKAGRPDAYHEDQVHYLTDDQFGYAAAIDGMVVREKPATIFYMGAFYAESLILAETGNASGAIQIAGTAMPSQLPFFVASCDYTLIGEELFAASAYLSREPKLLGSLKGQDMGKALILVAIIIGTLLETFGIWDFSRLFSVID